MNKFTPEQYAESEAKHNLPGGSWMDAFAARPDHYADGTVLDEVGDTLFFIAVPVTQPDRAIVLRKVVAAVVQLPNLLIERDALKAENERLRKALEALVWPNVPSADDMAVLVAMCVGNADRHRSAMELVDRLRIAQAEARAALQGGGA